MYDDGLNSDPRSFERVINNRVIHIGVWSEVGTLT